MLKFNANTFTHLDLEIESGKIIKTTDCKSKKELRIFPPMATASGHEKLYLLKEGKDFVYVGVTKQNIRTRFWYGLTASIKRPYLYKWRTYSKLQLFVWSFGVAGSTSREQLENIEAEVAFIIRKETRNWPLSQNEIHFNNSFPEGRLIAEKIFAVANNI